MSDHRVHNTLSILCHSILVAGLALVPEDTDRYIYLGLASALLVYHVALSQTPAAKINILTGAIASANQLLTLAPSTSARDQVMSMDQELLLRIAEKSKSQLQCQLLEIEGHGWKEYLCDVRSLLQSIDECTKNVKRIQSKLQLMNEQDTQRKLEDDIQKSREMLTAIHFGPRRSNIPGYCACTARTELVQGTLSQHLTSEDQNQWTQASTSGLGNHGNVERRGKSSSAQRAPRRVAAPGRAGLGAEPQSGGQKSEREGGEKRRKGGKLRAAGPAASGSPRQGQGLGQTAPAIAAGAANQ
ncbi:hypothetical protein GGX14DRAFT_405014 [Mycena pura]|uniref:Uncharacterized protein n=1 Tax=Mycena pura TaxID=153505 RepID=A0AAD6UT49_9AGAR|nr:hypothetical protein GGX14DRAFT_405014 [Mycena pura]